MKERLKQLMQEAEAKMASIASLQEAEELRIKLLGKKGELTDMLKGMKDLAPEERKSFGQAANEARAKIENTLNEKMDYFRNMQKEMALAAERVDVTEPAVTRELGNRHLLSVTIDEITSCFRSMGFSVVEGPEVETVFNNFDALNAGPNHPARDITDTFYITDDVLLRTQTSPVQVRTLLAQKPPIKVIAPGRCFRCDTPDATHSPMFHQVEGLVVD
ncbi:MAG: phenylalanine--tRNA ligase subunit alpha, partial [Firmicutes bacterium]|nr:phenylalanine--tRNA ligase subunit alpha [Bacillota bacterium]